MQNATKYTITFLLLLSLSLGYYSYALQSETVEKRIERENRELLLKCLDTARSKLSSQEVLRATQSCNENILTKITKPVSSTWSGEVNNSWTVTPAISGVPLWKVKNHIDYSKKTEENLLLSGKIKSENQFWKTLSKSNSFWQTYDLAIPLIRKYEWLHLTAYWDHAGYSIGYWTRAKSPKETITREEADRRLWYIVKQLVTRISSDFPTLNSKQQAGLVSFSYNCEIWYRDVKNHWLIRHSLWCKTASGRVLDWLVKRRAEEALFLYSKN